MLAKLAFIFIGGPLGLASYLLFRPYVDALLQKIILNMIAVPALLALFLPPLRNEGPVMIAIYFLYFAVIFAITTYVLHFAKRWLYRSDIEMRT